MTYMRALESSVHKSFASSLPTDIRLMFAYGSGVFKQLGHLDDKANMLDYILAVDDPISWHKENLSQNRNHYSFLKYGGAKFIADIQRGLGAGIYFNSLVPFGDRKVKYGVIATEDLQRDLKNWHTLYVSGRLHKPVLIVQDSAESVLRQLLHRNLLSALEAALLLLPDYFTDEELFMQISNLSFAGDFRMIVGEDKNKIRNIVVPHLGAFRDLYHPVFSESPVLDPSANFATFRQDVSPNARYHLLQSLPKNIRERVIRDNFSGNRNKDVSVILDNVSHSADCSKYVSKVYRLTVFYSLSRNCSAFELVAEYERDVYCRTSQVGDIQFCKAAQDGQRWQKERNMNSCVDYKNYQEDRRVDQCYFSGCEPAVVQTVCTKEFMDDV